jgi:hypothetical protein
MLHNYTGVHNAGEVGAPHYAVMLFKVYPKINTFSEALLDLDQRGLVKVMNAIHSQRIGDQHK